MKEYVNFWSPSVTGQGNARNRIRSSDGRIDLQSVLKGRARRTATLFIRMIETKETHSQA